MKIFFMAITFMSIAIYSNACSICGCGGGNLFLGIYPSFKSKFIGVRYNYSEYNTVLSNDRSQFSHNYYNSVELWSGLNIGRRWQLFAFVPYHYNNQIDDDSKKTKKGIGDISILTSYKLINTHRSSKTGLPVSNQLWLGGGLKLNTGNFSVDPSDPGTTLADINNQIGTGSTDLLLNLRNVYQIGYWGLTSNINYKFGTKNQQGYQFGNKLSINSIAFYSIDLGKTTISPNIGMQFEKTDGNKLNGNKIVLSEGLDTGSYHTGGYTFNAIAGLELNVKNISIGFNIQAPLKQNYAANQTTMSWKSMLHLSIMF